MRYYALLFYTLITASVVVLLYGVFLLVNSSYGARKCDQPCADRDTRYCSSGALG